jgi:hypothetical protein
MAAHAKLGASNAHRWLNCPGSVSAEDGIPNTSSPFAEEGTTAHELAEQALGMALLAPEDVKVEDWSRYATVKANEFLDFYGDRDMADFVRLYVDHVNALAANADAVDIEMRVSYEDWVPGGFGTADAIIVKGDTLHICDLKYGMGVRVDAEENPQAMLYALGALTMNEMIFDIERIQIHIVQPRLDHISQWEISVPDLLRWAEWVKQRAEEALEEDAPRVPGEKQCRFCRAKASCAALQKMTQDVIMADFDDLDNAPKANTLTDAQMRRALEAKPVIEGWLGAIEGLVRERLSNGGEFPGYKLVEGRSNRQWENVEEAEQLLDELIGPDLAFTRKIISPAQAEKVLGKKRAGEIADLIVKPLGSPTLAPESDKRPAINISAGDFSSCADEQFSED